MLLSMKRTNTILLFCLILLTGCATIMSGVRQKIMFNSYPGRAAVLIDEVEVGKTPFQIKLSRNRNYQVMIKLDGYKTYETMLKRKFNAWYIGNIAFGGIIGLVIDPLTGAIYTLTPKEVNVELNGKAALNREKDNICVDIALEIDPGWKKVGQLEKQSAD